MRFWLFIILILGISSCSLFTNDAFYFPDDDGNLHPTKNYLNDRRGYFNFPKQIVALGVKHFVFAPKISAWAVYDEKGIRVRTGSASGGKDFCEDVQEPCRTITGSFKIYTKKGPECKSGEYPVETTGGARMPYCMYFYRGFTIHAAFEVPNYNSSHGCIRVLPSAAKWLNEEFLDIGSRVTVLSYE